MTRGLSKVSEIKEEIVKVDEKTAKRYRVVEEVIDLEALRAEKQDLEQLLATPEPTQEELVNLGKGQHPFYWNKTDLTARLAEVKKVLGE